MLLFRQPVLTPALATASIGSWAPTDIDHEKHHPKTTTSEKVSGNQMAAMNRKLKTMHQVHAKMLSAKTAEEKNVLMAKHMNAMRQGMESLNMMGADVMGAMKGEKHFPRCARELEQMMEKRMEMMELMLQMAMDRMPAPAQ